MSGEQTHLRVSEVTDIVRCSERTVRRWIAEGVLPSVKIGGTRLVAIADLHRLLFGAASSEDAEE